MRPVASFPVLCVWLFLVTISAPDTVCGQLSDTDGRPLKSGDLYYLVPAEAGTGGGVLAGSGTSYNSKSLCLVDVAQSPDPFNIGNPVYFIDNYGPPSFLRPNEDLRIEFGAGVPSCAGSNIWGVRYSPALNQTFISLGASSEKLNSQFRILLDGDAYKFVHFSSDSSTYSNVGVWTNDSGVRNLVLSDKPLRIKFQRGSQTNHRSEKPMLRMFPFY